MPASTSRNGRPGSSKFTNIHIQLLLCLPPFAFWLAVEAIHSRQPSVFGGCSLETLSQKNSKSECPIKDVIEPPRIATHALLLLTTVNAVVANYKSPTKLKRVTLYLHFVTTVAIRCLSSFSGYSSVSSNSPFLFSSNSLGKVMWLWLLVESGIWDCSYLGHYADFYYTEATRSVRNEQGDVSRVFTSEKTGDEVEDADYSPYSPMFLPWEDVVVRLSYIHLVDNAIHIYWLRYSLETPYTSYINYSELLTILLFVQLCIYTYARVRSHVIFTHDEEICLGEKNFMPFSSISMTKDLVCWQPEHLRFRRSCKYRQGYIILGCILAVVAIATFEWLWLFWTIIGELIVEAYLKYLRDDAEEESSEV